MSAPIRENVLTTFRRMMFLGSRPRTRRVLPEETATLPVPAQVPVPTPSAELPVVQERRKEARYIPVGRRAFLAWRQNETFHTEDAQIENLSRNGAAVLVEEFPTGVTSVWVSLIGPIRPDWYAGRVVDVSVTGGIGRVVRIELARSLPYDVFKAIVWGIPGEDVPTGERPGNPLHAITPSAPTDQSQRRLA